MYNNLYFNINIFYKKYIMIIELLHIIINNISKNPDFLIFFSNYLKIKND